MQCLRALHFLMKPKKLRYFYLDNQLHKTLQINRPADLLYAWNYPEHKRITYVYSDARRKMRNAFTTKQVASLMNRHPRRIQRHLLDGVVEKPQMTYALESGHPLAYMWSEEDVLSLHEFLLTLGRGRPRKDGLNVPWRMPNRNELKAMMRHNTIMYVKTENGEFTPVWKEIEW